jgi:hypothetical protein
VVVSDPPHSFDTSRNFARAENVWFLRHREALARWPVLGEPWARRIEERRVAAESPTRHDETYFHGFR